MKLEDFLTQNVQKNIKSRRKIKSENNSMTLCRKYKGIVANCLVLLLFECIPEANFDQNKGSMMIDWEKEVNNEKYWKSLV